MPILRPSDPSKPSVIGSVEPTCLVWSSMALSSGIVSHASLAALIWLRKSAHMSAGSLSGCQKLSAMRSRSTHPGSHSGSWIAQPLGSQAESP